MIELCVEEYCHNCGRFIPVADINYASLSNGKDIIDTRIFCEYRNECIDKMEYLKKQLYKNEVNKND